ncbi:LRR domain containing protein [Parasponia andersonii]|uniref:LRR domain containing protein n=1 Tax=Parasponia andersonii TaxID=3476 RepID=A0A2P5CB42_PARAD|nr:LRR domain containing protein [Parasponia andersonii]
MLFIDCAVSYETSSNIRCIEKEKQALLEFKKGLADHSNILSSWSAENRDCCEWRGITCNNQTGGIIMLDLMERSLAGMINVSLLLELQYLSYLKLSYNDFHGGRIPNDIGRFNQLKELGLAQAGFVGPIPHQLGNLSDLQTLGLSRNNLTVDNLDWLSGLSSLSSLLLSDVTLSKVVNWPLSISKLPSLSELSSLVEINLSRNQLKGPIPDVFSNMICRLTDFLIRLHDSLKNLSCAENTLEYLYLSNNRSLGPFPDLTEYLTLRILKVDNNTGLSLGGPLPKNLGQHNKLDSLSLVDNKLSGPLSDFTELSSLTSLFLKNNQLNLAIPKSMGKLSSLRMLDLSNNSLHGVVTEAHFSNLSRLWFLDISHNSFLSFNFNSDWIPPFQLDTLHMTSCDVGSFPIWLRTQRKLSTLDMANANISDAIPDWFWNNLSSPWYNLNLSFNQIHGKLPNLSSMNYLSGTLRRASKLLDAIQELVILEPGK